MSRQLVGVYHRLGKPVAFQAWVFQKADNATQQVNHYPVDSMVCFVNSYLLDFHLIKLDMCDILQKYLSCSLKIESIRTRANQSIGKLHISQAVMGFQQGSSNMKRVKIFRCFALLQKRKAILLKTSPHGVINGR